MAGSYLDRFARELDEKPFDRRFLDIVATTIGCQGWVVDLGSGPSQIGAYLAGQGLRILSVDLSLGMLREASDLLRGGSLVQADMRALPFADDALVAIVAFYSLIHIPPDELNATLGELRRVLVAGGHLAATVHSAPPAEAESRRGVPRSASLHVDKMLSQPVDLDFYFYSAAPLTRALDEAGFELVQCTEREPYGPDVEAQTRRAYILAQRSE